MVPLIALPLAAQGVREIDLRVPSDAAGPAGLAVRLAVPSSPRHEAGAPVVVQVPGGWGPGELGRILAPLAPLGFIEVRFLFPGETGGPIASGGSDDVRGPLAIQALADVAAYAAGQSKDAEGLTLAQRCAPIVPAAGNVGLLGWSNGGCQAALALANCRRQTQGIAWLATWESPFGEGAQTALCGTHETGPNPAHDPRSGTMSWAALRYDERLPVQTFGGRPGPPGALYFDFDADGRPSDRDLPIFALAAPAAGEARFAYPLSVIEEALRAGLIGRWPAHLLPRDATVDFWREREAAGRLLQARINRQPLLAMVLATARDHVQSAPDHPHILAAYDGWLQAKLGWVRLNPDRAYLAALAGGDAADQVPENEANMIFGRPTLPDRLAPAGSVPAPLLAAAAACELADRVAFDRREPDLDTVLAPTSLRRPAAR